MMRTTKTPHTADPAGRLLAHYRDWEDREISSEQLVTDMLATLRHFADTYSVDFADADRIAYAHYRAERAELLSAEREGDEPLPGFSLDVPDACTGYIDTEGHLAHDGTTCPVHEVPHATVRLDVLASNVRTALTDPGGLPVSFEPAALNVYVVDQLDEIIETLNPSTETADAFAAGLRALGDHVGEIGGKCASIAIDEPEENEPYRQASEAIEHALDFINRAVRALEGKGV